MTKGITPSLVQSIREATRQGEIREAPGSLNEATVREKNDGPLRYHPETRHFTHMDGRVWQPEHQHKNTDRQKASAMAEHGIHLTGKERQLFNLDPHGHLSGPRQKGESQESHDKRRDHVLRHLYGGIDEPERKIVDIFHTKLHRKLNKARDENRFNYFEEASGSLKEGFNSRSKAWNKATDELAKIENETRTPKVGSPNPTPNQRNRWNAAKAKLDALKRKTVKEARTPIYGAPGTPPPPGGRPVAVRRPKSGSWFSSPKKLPANLGHAAAKSPQKGGEDVSESKHKGLLSPKTRGNLRRGYLLRAARSGPETVATAGLVSAALGPGIGVLSGVGTMAHHSRELIRKGQALKYLEGRKRRKGKT